MTAKLWASAPVPAVVGTATIGRPGVEVRAVVLELPDRAIVDRPEVDRLRGVHRRPAADRDDDRVRQPEGPEAGCAALDGGRGGVRLDVGEHVARDAGSGEIDRGCGWTIARSPDSRIGHHERARATGRRRPPQGVARRRQRRRRPGCAGSISIDRSARRVTRRSRRPCRSRCRAGPSASAGSRTSGTSARW